MKLTLLQIVQRMLAAVDAENVTDVGETEEADMCVQIINRVFEQIAVSRRWRHFKTYSALGTTSNKNEMSVPDGTYALDPESVYYNDTRVDYRNPEWFLRMTIRRNTDESNIIKVNGIKVYSDRDPIQFTSDDDETIRFDAFPDASGLVSSKSDVIVWALPTSLYLVNTDVLDMPASVFPSITEMCVGRAMLELQQNSEGRGLITDAKRMISKLGRTARLVDVRDDRRDFIVPRRPFNRLLTSQISFVT